MLLSKKAKIIYLSAAVFGLTPTLAIAEPSPKITMPVKPVTLVIESINIQQIKQIQQVEYRLEQAEQIEKQMQEKIQKAKLLEDQKQKEEETRKVNLNKFMKKASSIKSIINMDLRTPSGLSVEDADSILEGTGLEGLGKDFVNAEKTYKVNAVYLMAHAAWESGWGTSQISKSKNNLFGFGAYDTSPGSSAIKFKTKGDCILAVAKYISKHYLEEEGDHYNGSNLKGMNVVYASDDNWASGISSVMISLINKQAEPL